MLLISLAESAWHGRHPVGFNALVQAISVNQIHSFGITDPGGGKTLQGKEQAFEGGGGRNLFSSGWQLDEVVEAGRSIVSRREALASLNSLERQAASPTVGRGWGGDVWLEGSAAVGVGDLNTLSGTYYVSQCFGWGVSVHPLPPQRPKMGTDERGYVRAEVAHTTDAWRCSNIARWRRVTRRWKRTMRSAIR